MSYILIHSPVKFLLIYFVYILVSCKKKIEIGGKFTGECAKK